ncbi:hypothetical protein AOC36_02270 [Erysipelothrix larvae]|uniref:Uncharacterized protein n=1 Tax=Erysipelothrix larvae TaxID=1514105 RepID=A0A120JTH1_9FIRM|nr:hypothetical protein AOC36_02270 [Erysipelothrix larvae]
MRTRNSSTQGTLIKSLFPYIDTGRNGNRPIYLNTGLQYWTQKNSTSFDAMNGAFPPFIVSKRMINKGYPVMVGTLKLNHSDNDNHWVRAYRYQDNGSRTRYY